MTGLDPNRGPDPRGYANNYRQERAFASERRLWTSWLATIKAAGAAGAGAVFAQVPAGVACTLYPWRVRSDDFSVTLGG